MSTFLQRKLNRPSDIASWTGFTLLVVGAGVMLAYLTTAGGDDAPPSVVHAAVMRLAADALVVGVLLLVYGSLRRRSHPSEEAYRLGYDVGFENGYRTGRDSREPAAPATLEEDGERHYDVVVQMSPRRVHG